MKAAPFAYHVAGAVAEAVGTLAAYGDEAKVLASGCPAPSGPLFF